MAGNIKIRAKSSNGVTTVKALMSHEMETGLRKDKATGEPIPAHFIQEVTGKWNDQVVMTAFWSGGVSKNPYLSFKFNGGEKGESVEISWVDNQGQSESGTAEIS
ncbi:thiosulfate oxidation carrier complex protein SoxZ [Lamprobacter modestohalophilus]|uniref:Thiosulfate oxidation carrier complex protein SoxZ n=1 Tax=Lamprobacter modestohalophilus TaxID=1064514 RepID=A0A9X1B5I3_9GAMM|nr:MULTISPECIES: thiosulfate oxidation carrier complex protein SoxZ [Chromatiaceae]MCF7978218.1 thiosulfate oxidation carrier complex protein SoxZ [Chromatiaceae bacterium]MBK1620535.1 thiosulfate oxidation carrier complex protein SoxZ [Lamprobacter modestohalophilus]MBK5940926.1 thiosulfate oxidation carrier complex protein SoxZ [Halochromatium roseum]MCF7997101.1 thiosulfate oxidation carrier complex protein SoxZ [Chromatiaceae bacterium]MCF8004933.1 thiosulfate oxidation carrier complex pro